MSSAGSPGPARKRLPVRPSIENLRKQAKRLARDDDQQLAGAQHALAREYGFRNWPELIGVVEQMNATADQLESVKIDFSALVKAVDRLDAEAVRRMIVAGEYTQLDLDRGLAHACWYDRIGPWAKRKPLAELLLDAGADVNGQYGSGYGPIVFGCCECMTADGLTFLIEHGADVSFAPIATKYGPAAPITHLVGNYVRGRNEAKHRCIEILLRHGAQVDDDAWLSIHRGDARRLQEFLDRDPDLVHRRFAHTPYVDLRGTTLLHTACDQGEWECVQLLIERGADVNARADVPLPAVGATPVSMAVGSWGGGNIEVLRGLIKRYAPRIDWSLRMTAINEESPVGQQFSYTEKVEAAVKAEYSKGFFKTAEEERQLLRRVGAA